VKRKMMGEILEPRTEEVLSLLHTELEQKQLHAGGGQRGGADRRLVPCCKALPELAGQIFGKSSRRGYPAGVGGLAEVVSNPMYATAVGLVLYGARNKAERKFRIRDVNIFNRITSRMRKWF
jgi:cell division protein FtsA